MANVFHFVVLGILAINVTNGDEAIDEQTFPKYVKACISKGQNREVILLCLFTTTGILGGDYEFNTDRFKKILHPHVVLGKQDEADTAIKKIQDCFKKAGSIKFSGEARRALENCNDELNSAQKLLHEAISKRVIQ